MEDLDLKEKLWGGIFGVLAIIAALGEMLANGISAASVLGAIKDVSGTLVVVVLLVTVVKSLIPKKDQVSFSVRMEKALDKWRAANSNMIVKTDKSNGSKDQYGLSMKTDMNAFYGTGKDNSGVFFRMPALESDIWSKGNIEIKFWLNIGTFLEGRNDLNDKTKEEQLKSLAKNFSQYISLRYSDFCEAVPASDKVIVTIKKAVQKDEEINRLIELINSMYQAYLVSANIVIK